MEVGWLEKRERKGNGGSLVGLRYVCVTGRDKIIMGCGEDRNAYFLCECMVVYLRKIVRAMQIY